jgi:signal transduction histidine kinase
MTNEEPLLYVRRASRNQIAVCLAMAGLLFTAFIMTLPFATIPLPRSNAFVPVVSTVLILGDGVTAALLFSQAAVLRSRALAGLATGYLFSSLMVVSYVLSFPSASAPSGLIGGGVNTTPWLYVFWHCGLPCAVIAYTVLRRSLQADPASAGKLRPSVSLCVAATILAALGLTLLSTVGHDLLPPMMVDAIYPSPTNNVRVAAVCASLLHAVALAALWRGQRSLLNIWLMVTMWAWLLETALVVSLSGRYNLGWYSGRAMGMVSGVFVLIALMVEISRLYLQSALSFASAQQQREARLMSLDAAASAIAHEVKQPITAMVTNASAALIRARQDKPDLAKVTRSLEQIVENGHRAAEVVGSVRALFGTHKAKETLVDVNELIRETLQLRSMEIGTRAIVTWHDLAPDLPQLKGQRLQIRQVFLNLLDNAIEALAETSTGPRQVVIRSATAGGGVVAEVSDTGSGIAADQLERIFDAFYTTKTYGTGIGLPLCRSIIEGHGGQLWVTSTVGQGTKFHLKLPGPQP